MIDTDNVVYLQRGFINRETGPADAILEPPADEPDDFDPIASEQAYAAAQAVRSDIERYWRNVSLTPRAIREMDQERREQLVWWVRGGGPTVAEVDAHGGPFSPAELRERWQRSR